MNHDQYRQWLMLSLYGELDPMQQETLDEHLQQCGACRSEMEELKAFRDTLGQRGAVDVDEDLLRDARRQFRNALVAERSKRSVFAMLRRVPAFRIGRPVLVAAGGIVVFAIGVIAGRGMFPSASAPVKNVEEVMMEKAVNPVSGTQIENVRIGDGVSNEGNVDIAFDAIIPLHIQGNVNDPKVQRILATALLSSRNPGIRFQTANMLASRSVAPVAYDADVKDALITALETDENPGVRKEALSGLQKFPFDDQIKRAYMRVLLKDKNSGMRIEVINALSRVSSHGAGLGPDVISVLRQKQQSDENEYIRSRATTLLEGVRQ